MTAVELCLPIRGPRHRCCMRRSSPVSARALKPKTKNRRYSTLVLGPLPGNAAARGNLHTDRRPRAQPERTRSDHAAEREPLAGYPAVCRIQTARCRHYHLARRHHPKAAPRPKTNRAPATSTPTRAISPGNRCTRDLASALNDPRVRCRAVSGRSRLSGRWAPPRKSAARARLYARDIGPDNPATPYSPEWSTTLAVPANIRTRNPASRETRHPQRPPVPPECHGPRRVPEVNASP
jgi:hypothetical protein